MADSAVGLEDDTHVLNEVRACGLVLRQAAPAVNIQDFVLLQTREARKVGVVGSRHDGEPVFACSVCRELRFCDADCGHLGVGVFCIPNKFFKSLFANGKLHHQNMLLLLRVKVKEAVSCTPSRCRKFIFGFLPILTWLPNYSVKQYLPGDIIGGVTTAIVRIPQSKIAIYTYTQKDI